MLIWRESRMHGEGVWF